MEKIQSQTIDVLRFPLIVLVVFIHLNPKTTSIINADFSVLSGQGIYNICGILFSSIISHIAVPTFYLISGYLFFVNFNDWNWFGYKKKMKSRLHSLIIPYLSWNLIAFITAILFIVLKIVLDKQTTTELLSFVSDKSWHIFYDCNKWGINKTDWLGNSLCSTGPYDLPLWFLRDLIVVTILTPVIYFFIKKFKIYAIYILFFAYVSRIWLQIPGFGITAIFFFSLGSFFSINNLNIIDFLKKNKYVFLPISTLLLILAILFFGTDSLYYQNLYPFYVSSGVLSAFYIASILVEKYNIKANKLLVSSCFFIYAFHVVPIPHIKNSLKFTERVLHIIIPMESSFEDIICYFLAPAITICICIGLFLLLKKIFPNFSIILSGNR